LGESLKQILEKHRKRTISKPTIKPSTILSSGKDIVSASKCRGVVYEIPCGECKQKYIGKAKRNLSALSKEHHSRDTWPRNILKNPEKTALTKHAA